MVLARMCFGELAMLLVLSSCHGWQAGGELAGQRRTDARGLQPCTTRPAEMEMMPECGATGFTTMCEDEEVKATFPLVCEEPPAPVDDCA